MEYDSSFIKPPENEYIDSDDDSLEDCFFSLDSMPLADFCANCDCGAEVAQLKKCSRCKITQYCSQECQREN